VVVVASVVSSAEKIIGWVAPVPAGCEVVRQG
jgi:hypothetical protein